MHITAMGAPAKSFARPVTEKKAPTLETARAATAKRRIYAIGMWNLSVEAGENKRTWTTRLALVLHNENARLENSTAFDQIVSDWFSMERIAGLRSRSVT